MDAKQFFEEVEKMRSIQQEYFKTRSSLTLQASKKQERIIDDEIERVRSVLKAKDKNEQMNLGL